MVKGKVNIDICLKTRQDVSTHQEEHNNRHHGDLMTNHNQYEQYDDRKHVPGHLQRSLPLRCRLRAALTQVGFLFLSDFWLLELISSYH